MSPSQFLEPEAPPEPPRRKGPLLISTPELEQADPSLAAPIGHADELTTTLARLPRCGGMGLGALAVSVLGALLVMVLSQAIWTMASTLLQQNPVLGSLAWGLIALALVLLALLALREVSGLWRMRRLDRLRAQAVAARATANLAQVRGVADAVLALYQARPDLAPARARLAQHRAEVLDADALLALTETEMLAPLDRAALTEVEAAARQVATITALVPLALADVAVALVTNLRMIRRLAEIYGGRAGGLGSLRLLRRVAMALAGAGAMALADDLIGSVASGGVLAKLSRRFGEGVVNGALTARVGLAAMAECRPLPFVAQTPPGVTATVARALGGLVARTGAKEQAASASSKER